MGDISIRKWIRWPPAAEAEPTSTIVLTSPERRFVDVRILLDPPAGSGGLDWAIAGTSSRTEPDGSGVQSAVWNHWVDSRTIGPMRDEAQVKMISEYEELEWGRMSNPDIGKEADYEELWVPEEPVDAVKGDFVVLQIEDEAQGEMGMLIRFAQYCQGILRARESVTVERWKWTEGRGWVMSARFGEDQLPPPELLERPGEMAVGREVQHGGRTWAVIEAASPARDPAS